MAWNEHLAGRLDRFASPLLAVVNRRLQERHELLCIWQGATRTHDVDTWHREAVEGAKDGYRYGTPVDTLIEAARDCVVYLSENDPSVAAAYIDHMARADAPLLRRIAVHGTTRRADLSADQRIQWLLDHESLYDTACVRESTSLLEQTYVEASTAQRKLVLAAVDGYPDVRRESRDRDE